MTASDARRRNRLLVWSGPDKVRTAHGHGVTIVLVAPVTSVVPRARWQDKQTASIAAPEWRGPMAGATLEAPWAARAHSGWWLAKGADERDGVGR